MSIKFLIQVDHNTVHHINKQRVEFENIGEAEKYASENNIEVLNIIPLFIEE